jgi:hypothetical protein
MFLANKLSFQTKGIKEKQHASKQSTQSVLNSGRVPRREPTPGRAPSARSLLLSKLLAH